MVVHVSVGDDPHPFEQAMIDALSSASWRAGDLPIERLTPVRAAWARAETLVGEHGPAGAYGQLGLDFDAAAVPLGELVHDMPAPTLAAYALLVGAILGRRATHNEADDRPPGQAP